MRNIQIVYSFEKRASKSFTFGYVSSFTFLHFYVVDNIYIHILFIIVNKILISHLIFQWGNCVVHTMESVHIIIKITAFEDVVYLIQRLPSMQ